MNGSTNIQQLRDLGDIIETLGIVSGQPGHYSLSLIHSVAAAAQPAFASPMAGGVGLAERPVAAFTSGQAAIANAAIAKSNAAALTTPSAASGSATSAATPVSVITAISKGLPILSSTPQNVQTIEAGATATLHWWGWSVTMNESATQVFKALLQNDLEGLTAIALALAPVSAPLAAVCAILNAVANGLAAWITAADTKGKGVTISGYLWIGIDVTGNP